MTTAISQFENIDLSIVIPIYNEEKNITRTLHELRQFIPVSHEIIAVYDYEEDPTVPVLKELSKEFSNLKIVKNHIKRGPSGALRSGFEAAKGERVLVVMADLCDDLSQIHYFLQQVPAKADIVCPSRYCKGGGQLLKRSLKKWIPRCAGFMLQTLSGLPTYDPTNSFKLYSAQVLNSMELKSTISFSVTLEIVAKAHCLGFRIMEVPTVWKDRQFGKSNFKLMQSIVAYLPWFFVTCLKSPLMPISQRKRNEWFGRKEQIISHLKTSPISSAQSRQEVS